jgi:translation initiation factor IF-1
MSKKQNISKSKNADNKRPVAVVNTKKVSSKFIEQDGTVVENCGNTNFKIQLDINDLIVNGTISGKMRTHYIKVGVGDRVKVELTPYDLTKCRIVKRLNINL